MGMNFDPLYLPYPSTRFPVYARGGMAASSSPQASAAGLEALRAGGNAVDAAVAAAATLTVTEPTANGIGSDAFAIVWAGGKLHGLNASGRAPAAISIEKLRSRYGDLKRMPMLGWAPVMVPGAPSAWAALNERFGRLPLTKVMAPAVAYAREGYPLSPNLPGDFARTAARYKAEGNQSIFGEWFKTFLPGGSAPRAGDMLILKNHAATLEAIAETRAEAFYRGELAERIVKDSDDFGGFFSKEDFASYHPDWVEPVSVNYRGYDVWEIPPNGQGITALMALNILKEFDFYQRESAETFHKQWEAMKLAFSDTLAHITDPAFMREDFHQWLLPEYGRRRAKEIGFSAAQPVAQKPPRSGTVYLCTADDEGNMVSYIQSNYMGFGSGVVVRDTGIALQNRGYDFSLDPKAPNALGPGKKCYHTIIPGFLTKEGRPLGPFGVMGGYMQPQGHVQVITNLLDFGLNPQQALDAPRWQWLQGKAFTVESRFSAEIARSLAARGHEVSIALEAGSFGRGQIILRQENGVLIGATESRTDSNIACW
ncbi:gamma-glutamyltransferase [Spirochaetia bacterium]|nr:gamma-glutamyltransferase [Spirochaetia bacterium]